MQHGAFWTGHAMDRDGCTATQPKTTPDLYFQAHNETRKQTSTSPLVSASRGGGEKTKPAIGQGPGVGELLTKRLVVDRERAIFRGNLCGVR